MWWTFACTGTTEKHSGDAAVVAATSLSVDFDRDDDTILAHIRGWEADTPVVLEEPAVTIEGWATLEDVVATDDGWQAQIPAAVNKRRTGHILR